MLRSAFLCFRSPNSPQPTLSLISECVNWYLKILSFLVLLIKPRPRNQKYCLEKKKKKRNTAWEQMDSLSLIGIYRDRGSRGRERQVVCTQFHSRLLLLSLQPWGYVLISKSYSFCRWQRNFKPWTPVTIQALSWLPRVFLSFALTRL